MTPTVEEIVKGLSESMRHVMTGPVRRSFGNTISMMSCARTLNALATRGLMNEGERVFTPLGLSVRTYLESMGDGNG